MTTPIRPETDPLIAEFEKQRKAAPAPTSAPAEDPLIAEFEASKRGTATPGHAEDDAEHAPPPTPTISDATRRVGAQAFESTPGSPFKLDPNAKRRVTPTPSASSVAAADKFRTQFGQEPQQVAEEEGTEPGRPVVTMGRLQPIGVPKSEVERVVNDPSLKTRVATRLALRRSPDGMTVKAPPLTFADVAGHTLLNYIASPFIGGVADLDTDDKLRRYAESGGKLDEHQINLLASLGAGGAVAGNLAVGQGLGAGAGMGASGAEAAATRLGMAKANEVMRAGAQKALADVAAENQVQPSQLAKVIASARSAVAARGSRLKDAAVSGVGQAIGGAALTGASSVAQGETDPATIAKAMGESALEFGLMGAGFHALSSEAQFRAGYNAMKKTLEQVPDVKNQLASEKMARTGGEPGDEFGPGGDLVVRGQPKESAVARRKRQMQEARDASRPAKPDPVEQANFEKRATESFYDQMQKRAAAGEKVPGFGQAPREESPKVAPEVQNVAPNAPPVAANPPSVATPEKTESTTPVADLDANDVRSVVNVNGFSDLAKQYGDAKGVDPELAQRIVVDAYRTHMRTGLSVKDARTATTEQITESIEPTETKAASRETKPATPKTKASPAEIKAAEGETIPAPTTKLKVAKKKTTEAAALPEGYSVVKRDGAWRVSDPQGRVLHNASSDDEGRAREAGKSYLPGGPNVGHGDWVYQTRGELAERFAHLDTEKKASDEYDRIEQEADAAPKGTEARDRLEEQLEFVGQQHARMQSDRELSEAHEQRRTQEGEEYNKRIAAGANPKQLAKPFHMRETPDDFLRAHVIQATHSPNLDPAIRKKFSAGITDAELHDFLGESLGLGGGHTAGTGWADYKGGKNPVWSWGPEIQKPKVSYKGKALVTKVRDLLDLPEPGQAPAAPKKLGGKPVTPQVTEGGTKYVLPSFVTEPHKGQSKQRLGPAVSEAPRSFPRRDAHDLTNPIDPKASPEEKAAALRVLSEENMPRVQKLLADVDSLLGTTSKPSYKEPDKIVAKGSRPGILKEKPWHAVEHVRDSLRFKTPIGSISNLPAIAQAIREHGMEIVKVDMDKMVNPKEWGWRIAAFDLRMPNGQLAEYYFPIEEMDAKPVKGPNHLLFEKWRNRDTSTLTPAERREYVADVRRSAQEYEAAFGRALERMGMTEDEFATKFAAVAKDVQSAASPAKESVTPKASSASRMKLGSSAVGTGDQESLSSSAEGIPQSPSSGPRQTPSTRITGSDDKTNTSSETSDLATRDDRGIENNVSATPAPTKKLGSAKKRGIDASAPAEPKDAGILSAQESTNDTGKLRESVSPEPAGQQAGGVSGVKGGGGVGRLGRRRGGASAEPVRGAAEAAQRAGSGDAEAPVSAESPANAGDRAAGEGTGPGRGAGEGAGGRGEPDRVAKGKATKELAKTPATENFVIHDDLGLSKGAVARAQANLDAIKLLKELEASGSVPTRAQQEALSRYVGWGGLAGYVDEAHKLGQSALGAEIRGAMTPDELRAAKASTPNAHYTSLEVVQAIHDALNTFGFTGGKILEPSAGSGIFIGATPKAHAADYKWTGIELDSITGRIAKLLYPKSDIRVQGFEKLNVPDATYDVAVGNVPFGNYSVHDPRYNKLKLSIHDYFFAKSLDLVRPGGIVAYITSRYTLDRKDSSFRKYLADRADLIGAVRLPNTAFKGNAGTDVVTDLIILKRRATGVERQGPPFEKLASIDTPSGPATINEYFAAMPHMMLGKPSLAGTMYGGREEFTLEPHADEALGKQIAQAANVLRGSDSGPRAFARYEPASIESPATRGPAEIPAADRDVMAAPDNMQDGAFTLRGGKLLQKQGRALVAPEIPKANVEKVRHLTELKEAVKDLLKAEVENVPDAALETKRMYVNSLYDTFVKANGPINKETRVETKRLDKEGNPVVSYRYPNLASFSEDPEFPWVTMIEEYDPESGKGKKGDLMNGRVMESRRAPERVDTPSLAVPIVLAEQGKIDLARIAQLAGANAEDVVKALNGSVIFENPGSNQWEVADQYLSGDVKTKLAEARVAAEKDPRFTLNVGALEKAQPEDIPPSQIGVQLGAAWVPPKDIGDFISELLDVEPSARQYIKIGYTKYGSNWVVTVPSWVMNKFEATTKYGTARVNAVDLIRDALNLRQTEVTDPHPSEEGKRVKNPDATMAAQEKQQEIKDAFTKWIWSDGDRASRLAALYNEKMNRIRLPKPDGSHLTLPGAATAIRGQPFKLRPHQLNAVWRILAYGNTLLAHVVGSGKTYTMVAAGMEAKRLGLAKKPLYVVPNHMLAQFRDEFKGLYPMAKLLVATKDDFAGDSRREFVGRAAANDWDAVIMTHRSFESVPMSADFQAEFMQHELESLESAIREAKAAKSERALIKQIESAKKRREVKLAKLLADEKKDQFLSFEQMGTDMLFVDEAHYGKNLEFTTKMRGVNVPSSERAFDLYLKTQYLEKINPGRGIVFATGTPISNALSEMYTLQRYLQTPLLRERGVEDFDAWAATFAEPVTKLEIAPDGSGARTKTRLAKYNNVGELAQMFRSVTDVQSNEDLKLPRPELATGKMQVVSAPATPALKMFVRELVARAKAVKEKKVDPTEDNFLKITTHGRNAALDMRLVDASAENDPGSKLNLAAERIAEVYHKTADLKGAQLVFCDLSTPESDPSKSLGGVPNWNAYDHVKSTLVGLGVPAKEIRFMHDATSDEKKKKLFADVRSGRVRVLLGSTEKMGAGTNVQDRLVALHHLDAPWRPSDVEQRNGRILRQGNLLYNTGKIPHVEIFSYVTEGSFDAYIWQTLERKQDFIQQALKAGPGVRQIEDEGDVEVDFATAKAIASGNPKVMEKAQVDTEINRLERLQRAHQDQMVDVRKELARLPGQIKEAEPEIAATKKDLARIIDTSGDKFKATINGVTTAKRAEAGEMLAAAVTKSEYGSLKQKGEEVSTRLGTFAGLDLFVVSRTSAITGTSNTWLALRGDTAHFRELDGDESPTSLVSRLEHIPGAMAKRLDELEATHGRYTKKLAALKAGGVKAFEHDAKLKELKERQKSLDKELQADADRAEKEATESPEERDRRLKASIDSKQTNTAAFKEWFGDSKVVDEQGKPLVVYHGTPQHSFVNNFEVFDRMATHKALKNPPNMNMVGSWFATEPEAGSMYAGRGTVAPASVYPVFLSIKKPMRLTWHEFMGLGQRSSAYIKTPGKPIGQWNPDGLRKELQAEGYDGLFFPASEEIDGNKSDVWVAFDPEQIKSAIANRGTFDATNPNILHGFADPFTAVVKMYQQAQALRRQRLGLPPAPPSQPLQVAAQHLSNLNTSVQAIFSPTSLTPDAGKASRVIRAHRGASDRDIAKAHQSLEEVREALDKLQPGASFNGPRWNWYRQMEAGQIGQIRGPLRDVADVTRKLLDDLRDEIQAEGPGHLDTVIQNYMPRIYKEGPKIRGGQQAQVGMRLGKRPLEGPKSFKKKRSFATLDQALAAGYVPISDNPLDMVLLKLREMRRYLMAVRIKNELRTQKIVKFKKASRQMPDGYAKLDDRAFTVFAPKGGEGETRIRGEYVAPLEVARVVNNFLSPGLRGNPIYDSYAFLGNSLNMVQLGLSAFHAGFVAFDATVQTAALGMDEMLTGVKTGNAKMLGRGVGKFALGAVSAATGPVTVLPLPAAIASYMKGRAVWHAYLHDASSAEMQKAVKALTEAGGRAKMDDYYRNNSIDKMRQAFRDKRWAGTILQAPFAAIEGSMYPLLEHVVPRMKLGAFMQLAQHEMTKLPAGSTDDDYRKAMAKAWDAIDARLGQMVYDNRFWHRATKEIMMAGIRSVGWNAGSLDVTGGAVAQPILNVGRMKRGEPTEWHKVQYLAALAAVVAFYGAVYTYLHTGERPKNWKDYYFPRTGKTDRNGNADRMTPATYMKDIFAVERHPIQTIQHKFHPLLDFAAEILSNRDFYGDMIRNPDDPTVTQLQQVATQIGKDVMPFSVRNMQELTKRDESARTKVEGFLGNQAAPREVVRTEAQNKMNEFLARRGHPVRTPQQADLRDERQGIELGFKKGDVPRDSLRRLVRSGTLTRGQVQRMGHESKENPLVTKFRMLTAEEAQYVYDLGTPDEQKLWKRWLDSKVRRSRPMNQPQRLRLGSGK